MTRPTSARAPLSLAWLLAVVLAVVAAGCGVVPPLPAPAAPGPVGAQLEALTVVPRPRDDGTYRRAAFGRAWADVDRIGAAREPMSWLAMPTAASPSPSGPPAPAPTR